MLRLRVHSDIQGAESAMTKIKQKNKVSLSAKQLKPQPRMSLEQIEERLVKNILRGSLALQILRGSQKPVSKLMRELLEIEIEVSQFVGQAMQIHADNIKATNFQGVLASALSFIPIPVAQRPQIQSPSSNTWNSTMGKRIRRTSPSRRSRRGLDPLKSKTHQQR